MDKPNLPLSIRQWLQGALLQWQNQGIVSPEQADKILASYQTEQDSSALAGNKAVFILGSMAAFLFGAALMLVIGFNWQYMAREAKLATMLALVTALHGSGFVLRNRLGWEKAYEIVHFLGCLAYGAGIWLVAQAYHMDAHYPDGMWWWALGVFPFTFLSQSLLIHLLYTILLGIWVALEILNFQDLLLTIFFGWHYLPRGAYTLPLLALPGLILAYRKSSPVLLGLYLAALGWWAILQPVAWRLSEWTVFWFGGIGSIFLLLAQAHRQGDRMAVPFRVWGTLLAGISLLFVSSPVFWRELHSFDRFNWNGPQALTVTSVFSIFTILGVVATLVIAWRRSKHQPTAHPFDIGRLWLPASLGLGMGIFGMVALMGEQLAIIPLVFGNLAILGLAVLLIRVGMQEERVQPFAGGIFCFLIWTLVRYLDFFDASWGMLGAAGIFALTGVGLLLVARFWVQSRAKPPIPVVSNPEEWQGPDWLTRFAECCSRYWRPLIGLASALQVSIIVGMVAAQAYPQLTGNTYLLKVAPVDPRDFFRGDYVTLGYEIGRNAPGNLPSQEGKAVYVTLEKDADGETWKAKEYLNAPPKEGIYIRGKRQSFGRILFGTEAYFVQEGEGIRWENLIRERKVLARVAIAPNGVAKLVELVER